MKAVVIYESLTGNTRKLSGLIGDELRTRGVDTVVCPITQIDLQALSEADVVFVGSWTDGVFVLGQRPGRAARIQTMPALGGKDVFAFCTYAINPGKVLDKMRRLLEFRGARVSGGLAIHRNRLDAGAVELVQGALAAVHA